MAQHADSTTTDATTGTAGPTSTTDEAIAATGAVPPTVASPAAAADASLPASPAAPEPTAVAVDVEGLGRQLLGNWATARLHARELMAKPEFHRDPLLGKDEH